MADETTPPEPCDPRPVACLVQMDRMERKLDALAETGRQTSVILTGNSKPATGLVVRTDRLEQRSKAMLWAVRVIIGSLLAGGGGIVAAAVVHFGSTP